MNSSRYGFAVLIAAAVAVATPALAHHSYAMFDRTRTVTITGTVKTFQWTNPHVYAWLLVSNANGGADLWGVESRSPNTLAQEGWTKKTMQPGDKLTVELQPLKDGRFGGYFVRAVRADGTKIDDGAH